MTLNHPPTSTSQAPTWVTSLDEDLEDLDEPPERRTSETSSYSAFSRTLVQRCNDKSSLLTQAIMAEPEDHVVSHHQRNFPNSSRRRSMTSNISFASTADLTSDTGLTSPARTNTPSPPLPDLGLLRLGSEVKPHGNVSCLGAAIEAQKPGLQQQQQLPSPSKDQTSAPPRKRCIQFACAKPVVQDQPPVRPPPMIKTVSAQETRRPSCIKFVCPPHPVSAQNTPPRHSRNNSASRSSNHTRTDSPSTPRKASALSVALAAAANPHHHTRRPSNKSPIARPKFLRANSKDLVKDSSQFHAFASGISREDDWIRQGEVTSDRKLTIDDTLTKENIIRKLAKEAEEEAELEEEEEEAAIDEEEEEDQDDDNDDEDDDSHYDSDDSVLDDVDSLGGEEEDDVDLDGYNTDEETGFASSEEDDEEDEHMVLWTPSSKITPRPGMSTPTAATRSQLPEQLSDSSTNSDRPSRSPRRSQAQRVRPRSRTPDLPDSTDFVCGTLDEDRPLEEAYLTCLAARRKESLRIIPQDIDPSFPASEPENEVDEEFYNPVHHSSDEENVWMNGKMDDIHHDSGRSRARRRKSEQASPRKYRSPAPKRHYSPAPKGRNASHRPLFDRQSPRKARPVMAHKVNIKTPSGTPRQGGHIGLHLAGRPGLTTTKSLPRPAALFPHLRHGAGMKVLSQDDAHVRGAIDIVKGLERKRQRRKEKFHQKYCNRARRGQIPERKQKPGLGAERMKELGLLMAGKKDQGNYVLSV